MIEIDGAVMQLLKLKELGATHCWGWDDGSIQAGKRPEVVVGWADENGGRYWVLQSPNYTHFRPRQRWEAVPLT